jgi:dihydroneopterin aldolase
LDKITLKNMKFFAYHGILSEEREKGQNFFIDVELFLDLKKPGESDNLEDTVDYSKIYDMIKHITEENRFQLIEKLAESLTKGIMTSYPFVVEIHMRVRKPEAPINGILDYAEVELKRIRNEL